MSYLCLTGTGAFIYAENRLKNGFFGKIFFLFWGPTASFASLDDLGVKYFKS